MSTNKRPNGQYAPHRENKIETGNIAALNGEIIMEIKPLTGDVYGGESVLAVEVRWTFVGTFEVSWSVDGINYTPLSSRNAIIAITTVWVYRYNCSGYNEIRIRNTAYTSGTAAITMTASVGMMSDRGTTAVSSGLGTAAAAVTLTLPAVVGMRHYITRIEIWRVNGTAAAVAGSAILAITNTNLPANYGWNVANGIAAWAHEKLVDISFDAPLVSTTAGWATTIVMPAGGAGVQWRAQAHYFLGE